MNKNRTKKSSYRGLGSIRLSSSSKKCPIVGRIKEEPEKRGWCAIQSSLAPEGKSIAFRLDKDNGFEWIGEYDISADELLMEMARDRKRKAKEFLLEILADSGMSQKKIYQKKL